MRGSQPSAHCHARHSHIQQSPGMLHGSSHNRYWQCHIDNRIRGLIWLLIPTHWIPTRCHYISESFKFCPMLTIHIEIGYLTRSHDYPLAMHSNRRAIQNRMEKKRKRKNNYKFYPSLKNNRFVYNRLALNGNQSRKIWHCIKKKKCFMFTC